MIRLSYMRKSCIFKFWSLLLNMTSAIKVYFVLCKVDVRVTTFKHFGIHVTVH